MESHPGPLNSELRLCPRLAGYGYHRYYKYLVLRNMKKAFDPGDPVLELAALDSQRPDNVMEEDDRHWIRRYEQDKIDAIINGTNKGHYHLLIGEKGTGKSSMILNAMQKIDGEGVSMFEAHADLEIFRIRLGRALNYEFHEDYASTPLQPEKWFLAKRERRSAVFSASKDHVIPPHSWTSSARSTSLRRWRCIAGRPLADH